MLLNKYERMILVHRLEIPDAILEALTDTAPGDQECPFAPDDILQTCEMLLNHATTRYLPDVIWPVERAILEDVLSGNTYLIGLDDAHAQKLIRQREKEGILNAAKTLPRKFTEVYGGTWPDIPI